MDTGKPLQAKKFRKDNGQLYGAILYHFPSYQSFIEEVGLDYSKIADKRRWTDEEVIETFKNLKQDGHDVSPKSLCLSHLSLYAQISDRFGNYKTFLESLGYDYKELCKRRSWTKDEVKEELLKRVKNEESLLSSVLLNDHFALYKACRTVFGSYKNALDYCGISYVDVVGDMNIASTYGFVFEQTLSNMFDALGRNYIRHSRSVDNIIPDFYNDSENEIIDAKLSSWTVFHSDTIEKYSPHCDKLVIVYLRGPSIQKKTPGMELRHVSYYYEELRKNGLDKFITVFNDLLSSLESAEKEAVS